VPKEKSVHTPIIDATREHLLTKIKEGHPIHPYFQRHIEEVENWANRILPYYPEADTEIILLSVWLHDIGQLDGDYKVDHAIKSETEAISFLSKEKYPEDKILEVAHCVRSHRCKDVQPNSVEAKILAAADSASHMADIPYILMMGQSNLTRQDVLDKLERDFRDTNNFLPIELKPQTKQLYKAWKGLLEVFPKAE
jgi:23S rRNA maturation-related 3'-5' exoribonuclease YhaM